MATEKHITCSQCAQTVPEGKAASDSVCKRCLDGFLEDEGIWDEFILGRPRGAAADAA